ncbi:PREDICTED: uncharacterized protein LOC109238156 [Nicotiana attenuata]|uniref:uncharacterized protein LOC109238156 n=1 Tax=Nicotiana attenuata TaxID=49451 RepID=UPI000904914B|nr:PREDICTED: uncharacterized protein LOC109238156 [Nicotiana attenuata]
MWADFLKAKYCPRVHLVGKKWCSGNSQAWKHLLWARDKCEKQITWKINAGNCSFSWDNWTELGHLTHICSSYINTSNTKKKVNDFMSTNRWDAQMLYSTLPNQIALHIMSIELGQEYKNDYAVWNATEDGHFTNGSAWNMIRDHRTINITINKIWHKSIPFKQSFLCWRIFFVRISIRQTITRLIPKILKFVDVVQYLLWRPCNMYLWRVEQPAILQDTFPNLDTNGTWDNLCKLVEKLKLVVVCTPIHWNKPAPGWIKINIDGSFIKASRKAGIGGIVRDSNGDFIFAFSIPIQANSSSKTEVIAVRFGVEWCTQHGYSNIHVEIDSLIVTNILIKQSFNNLKLQHIIKGTTTMLDNTVSCIFHCLREAN